MVLGRISGIIVAGGDGSSSVDFWAGDLGIKKLPNLPLTICGSSMVAHNGTVLFCGGRHNEKKCLQMDNGTWKEHSTLNKERVWHSAVTTKTATFVFGGCHSYKTYEYLPHGSSTWYIGKTEIPEGLWNGYAITVKSEQEIWLIGGENNENRILTFNVSDHTFTELPSKLIVGRFGQKCAFIPKTNKIMITGGYCEQNGRLDSAEIVDTQDGNVTPWQVQ